MAMAAAALGRRTTTALRRSSILGKCRSNAPGSGGFLLKRFCHSQRFDRDKAIDLAERIAKNLGGEQVEGAETASKLANELIMTLKRASRDEFLKRTVTDEVIIAELSKKVEVLSNSHAELTIKHVALKQASKTYRDVSLGVLLMFGAFLLANPQRQSQVQLECDMKYLSNDVDAKHEVMESKIKKLKEKFKATDAKVSELLAGDKAKGLAENAEAIAVKKSTGFHESFKVHD